jgi:hypothetical protein
MKLDELWTVHQFWLQRQKLGEKPFQFKTVLQTDQRAPNTFVQQKKKLHAAAALARTDRSAPSNSSRASTSNPGESSAMGAHKAQSNVPALKKVRPKKKTKDAAHSGKGKQKAVSSEEGDDSWSDESASSGSLDGRGGDSEMDDNTSMLKLLWTKKKTERQAKQNQQAERLAAQERELTRELQEVQEQETREAKEREARKAVEEARKRQVQEAQDRAAQEVQDREEREGREAQEREAQNAVEEARKRQVQEAQQSAAQETRDRQGQEAQDGDVERQRCPGKLDSSRNAGKNGR